MKEFSDLAREARPLQDRLDEIKMRQLELAHEAALEILAAAYPAARARTVRALAILKPSDTGAEAHRTVQALKEAGLEPKEILIDSNRMVITLNA